MKYLINLISFVVVVSLFYGCQKDDVISPIVTYSTNDLQGVWSGNVRVRIFGGDNHGLDTIINGNFAFGNNGTFISIKPSPVYESITGNLSVSNDGKITGTITTKHKTQSGTNTETTTMNWAGSSFEIKSKINTNMRWDWVNTAPGSGYVLISGSVTKQSDANLTDIEQIKNVLSDWKNAIETKNLTKVMSYVSDNYLNNGETKSDVQNFISQQLFNYDSIKITVTNILITIDGNKANLSAHFKFEIPDTTYEFDFNPVNPWILTYWLKESTGWMMYGNQRKANFKISIQHYYPQNYFIGISLSKKKISSYQINGSNISTIWMHSQDSSHIVVNLSARPTIGAIYNIQVIASDGNHYDSSYSVNGINDNFAWIITPPNGGLVTIPTPTFTWQAASNIESYHLKVTDDQGKWIWQPSFSVGTTTCVYNFDGRATAQLQSGRIYELTIHTFDSKGNQASTQSTFSVAY